MAPAGMHRGELQVTRAVGGDLPGQNHHFWLLSPLRAHTKVPYKNNLLWKTLTALNRPARARTAAGMMRSTSSQCSPSTTPPEQKTKLQR
jgi:hypothetical protein